ncbi:MAG: ComF family protein [Proteobacteria bacterium]|nr:ComF family protein [Pseudomonadota bacterium]
MGSLNGIIDFLYPRTCSACEKQTCSSEQRDNFFCPDCSQLLAVRHQASLCSICGEDYFSVSGDICPFCRIFAEDNLRLRSIFKYEPQIKKIIKQFKYHNQRFLAEYFSYQLFDALINKKLYPRIIWDIVLPLPSSVSMLSERGFNHCYLITKRLAEKLQLPCYILALQRNKDCNAQARLKLSKRLDNVEDSFTAERSYVRDRNILLVDDVITSGATIFSATKALFLSGAKGIDVLTVARSSNFSKNRLKLLLQLNEK